MNAEEPAAATGELQDLLVIGGGINGVGITRDAAGRGLKVTLCEKDDLASGTSSASTKLIHGGLRYLEYAEFRLVREALSEREVLLNMAPHIIWPLRFVLPHIRGMRSAWLLRTGLFIYDHLGGREKLPVSSRINLAGHMAGEALANPSKIGFEFSDCWVDDSRLVVLNAMDAAERGANILTRSRFVSANRGQEFWNAYLQDADGTQRTIRARALVNAAGPWVSTVAGQINRHALRKELRLVKGSHLVTKRLFDGDHAFFFQNADGRIAFAIPYERDFTLIGTTEQPHSDSLEKVAISADETDYLIQLVNQYLSSPIGRQDIVWSYAGVRPLYEERGKKASAVSREYVLDLDDPPELAPSLSIYGGKLTTYRTLSEKAISKLLPVLRHNAPAWTGQSTLPGGDIPRADFTAFEEDMQRRWPWLNTTILHRLLRAYGTRIDRIIGNANGTVDIAADFGDDPTVAEVDYLCDQEFATTADDVLWRRSKLGLRLSDSERDALQDYIFALR